MKIFKYILISLIIAVIILGVYITIDCIRLRYSESYTLPLITFGQLTEKNKITYVGFGYTITYYQEKEVVDKDYDYVQMQYGSYGAEFRLFNKFLIWAWVE